MGPSGNGGSLCHEAREYYYALLCHDDTAVPEPVARHAEDCPFCQQQIRRLSDMLLSPGDPAGPAEDRGNEKGVEALSRQFEFLGEPVRCSQARAFLPDLATPSPQIRIPTPITVHIENCPRCAQDLASIRRLGLAAGQLKRLGRFYGRSSLHDPSHDGQARATVAALAAFSLDEAAPRDLDHVSRCPQCRGEMHALRARALAGLQSGAEGSGVLLCREISTADLFDYVLPFGLDAAAVARADGRRDAVVTHVRACRRCMERAQRLHQTIYEIADRADSAVSTLYQCDDGTQDASEEARASACRYPITVQVLQGEPASATAGQSPAGGRFRKRSRVGPGTRPLFKRTAVAAAAVIAVALLFSANAPIATATSIDGLLKNLQRMANIRVVQWSEGRTQPNYKMWVSRDLNKVASETANERVEYDLGKRLMRVRRAELPWSEPRKLSPDDVDSCASFIDTYINGIFALAGRDDNLSQIDSIPSSPDRPDVLLSVYELARETPGVNGIPVRHRWRVTVDPRLQLPMEIESSRRGPRESAWTSVTVLRLEYPTTPEMESEFRAMSEAK